MWGVGGPSLTTSMSIFLPVIRLCLCSVILKLCSPCLILHYHAALHQSSLRDVQIQPRYQPASSDGPSTADSVKLRRAISYPTQEIPNGRSGLMSLPHYLCEVCEASRCCKFEKHDVYSIQNITRKGLLFASSSMRLPMSCEGIEEARRYI